MDDDWFFTILLSYEGKKKLKIGYFCTISEKYIEKPLQYDVKYPFCSHFQGFMSYELILHILSNDVLIIMLI